MNVIKGKISKDEKENTFFFRFGSLKVFRAKTTLVLSERKKKHPEIFVKGPEKAKKKTKGDVLRDVKKYDPFPLPPSLPK